MEHNGNWAKVYEMHIGEILENLNGVDVRRVPGGWLMTDSVEMPSKFKGGPDYRHLLPPVFVPYCDERPRKAEPPPARPEPPPARDSGAERTKPPAPAPASGSDDDDLRPF